MMAIYDRYRFHYSHDVQGDEMMFVGLRDLWFAKGRFLLMTTVIALVAFLVVMLSGLTQGLAAQNTSAIAELPATHVVFAELPDGPSFTQSRLETSSASAWFSSDVVDEVAPLGITRASMTTSGAVVPVAVFGAEPDSFITPPELADGATAVITSDTAETYAIAPGAEVTIGDASFTATIVDGDASFSHSPVVWIGLAQWQNLVGATSTASVLILDASSDVAAIDATVVLPVDETFSAIGSFSEENGSLQMIRWFLLVISALVVGAFFTVWTIQRRHDVAVLKAMGASTRYLLVDALGQASIVLIGAASAGGAIGFLVGRLLSGAVPFVSNMSTTVIPLAGLVVVGLAGAALAIRSITKVDPLSALGGS
jgi:putative ABC transport system permease protein